MLLSVLWPLLLVLTLPLLLCVLRFRLGLFVPALLLFLTVVLFALLVVLRDAQNQADGQRWWLHAGNVALNVGVMDPFDSFACWFFDYEPRVARDDRQLPAIGHGVARVGRKIGDCRLQLHDIDHHRPHSGAKLQIDHNVLAERAAQQPDNGADGNVYVATLRRQRLTAPRTHAHS